MYVLYFCGICAVCTVINSSYFSVPVSSSGSMRSRNAVRAVGGALLTSIHEYRISSNRSPRLVLEQSCATRGLH